jgi:iron complex outermembrane receptor protein
MTTLIWGNRMKLKLSNVSRAITYALASTATIGLFSTAAYADEDEGAKKEY